MTPWQLIIVLVLLGGVLSTLGDFLGTKIGKARLSIFKLRPRSTAILITILTGSFISSISLSVIFWVDKEFRAGWFKWKSLQNELNESRLALAPLKKQRKALEKRIRDSEEYFDKLETSLSALRKGQVVISSGETLATFTIKVNDKSKIKSKIEEILRIANYNAYRKVKPNEIPNRRLLMITKEDVNRIETTISDKRKWVINIRSGRNVVLGETYVYVFPEITLNKKVISKGDVLASKKFGRNELRDNLLDRQVKILLTSSLAEAKRRGSLVSEVIVETRSVNNLRNDLNEIKDFPFALEIISLRDSESADQLSVRLSLRKLSS